MISKSEPSIVTSKTKHFFTELMGAPLSAKIGILIVVIYIFVALFAPLLAPFGESELVGKKYQPWNNTFLLGTDNLGRDMLSRILFGARNTVGIAFLTTLVAFLIGGICGIFAA
ncbi:uncharacterized protein METZ01_LOCUS201839, partial [marine metagenome]